MNSIHVVLSRGGITEAVHEGSFVEVGPDGEVRVAHGDPNRRTTLRSSAKPLQALPLFPGPGDELSDEEIAICCASHAGGDREAELAAAVLARAGVGPEALVCGMGGEPPSPLRHGCSGNHAAILLLARAMGASAEGYHEPDHPVQRRILAVLREVSGVEDIPLATDGCGIPTFGLTLAETARAFAALTDPERPWRRVPEAMGRHPNLVGPPERIDAVLMRATEGRVIAKTGAVGLLCLGLAGERRSMAVKIHDGDSLVLGPVTMHALSACGWLTSAELHHPDLQPLSHPVYTDPLGCPAAEKRLVVDP